MSSVAAALWAAWSLGVEPIPTLRTAKRLQKTKQSFEDKCVPKQSLGTREFVDLAPRRNHFFGVGLTLDVGLALGVAEADGNS